MPVARLDGTMQETNGCSFFYVHHTLTRPTMKTSALLRTLLAVATASLLALPVARAATVDVAGVKLEDRASLAGSPLVLNGAGVRYKAVFKVYAAGLYLAQKADTPEAVLAAPGPKRISITMLRDIDSAELGKLFSRGMEDNMDRSAFSKLIPGVLRMSQVFTDHKNLKEGDNFLIDWVPGTGTVLTIKGKVEGEPFKEPEFFNALVRIWLGPKPADWMLKDALLGKAKK
jgi:hypothetical protein